MSPESQRVALAELCGAVWIVIGEKPLKHYRMLTMVFNPEYCERASGDEVMCNPVYMWGHGQIPDFLHDLNACNDAEMSLSMEQLATMDGFLEKMERGYVTAIHATAPERCEAILKTLGKWVEAK